MTEIKSKHFNDQCISALEALAFNSGAKYFKATGDKSLLDALHKVLVELYADTNRKLPTFSNFFNEVQNGEPNKTFTKKTDGTYNKDENGDEDEEEEIVFGEDYSESDDPEDAINSRPLAEFFNKHDLIIQKIDQAIRDEGAYGNPDRLRKLLGYDYEHFIQIYPHIRVRFDNDLPSSLHNLSAVEPNRIFHSTGYGTVPNNDTFERSHIRGDDSKRSCSRGHSSRSDYKSKRSASHGRLPDGTYDKSFGACANLSNKSYRSKSQVSHGSKNQSQKLSSGNMCHLAFTRSKNSTFNDKSKENSPHALKIPTSDDEEPQQSIRQTPHSYECKVAAAPPEPQASSSPKIYTSQIPRFKLKPK